MRRALFIALLFTCFLVKPQQTNANNTSDSLLKAIPALVDTNRLEAIKQLTYTVNNIQTGLNYCRWLRLEAEKTKNVPYQAFAMVKMLEFYYSQFETDSLALAYQQYEKFCQAHGYYKSYYVASMIYIQRYIDQDKYALALDKALRVYEFAKKQQSVEGLVESLSMLSYIYSGLEQYPEAIRMAHEALQVIKNHPKADMAQKTLELYMYLAQHSENLHNYPDMLAYSDTFGVYIRKGMQQMPDVDFSFYQYVNEVLQTIGLSGMGQTRQAAFHLQAAQKLVQPEWPENHQQIIYTAYAEYYKATGQYQKALEYNQKELDFARQCGLGAGVKIKLQAIARIYEQKGDYRMATQTYRKLETLTDSINSERFSRQVNELKTIYDLDKLELLAEKTRLELKASRQFVVGLALVCLLLIALVLLILKNQRNLKQKNRALYLRIKEQDRLVAEQKQRELESLKVTSLEAAQKQSPEDELFNRLKALMDSEKLFTDAQLSRKALADKLSTNEAYLFESIKRNLGLTFSEYLTQLRLDLAREMLSQPGSNLTIEAVAIDSGFGSRNTFHRLFRERYGLTPVEFRKLAVEQT